MRHRVVCLAFITCTLMLAPASVSAQQIPASGPASRQMEAHPAGEEARIKQIVDGIIRPYLAENQAPGAIVGVSLHGHRYFFPYGKATDDGTPFTPDTLVEIGSCTKTFTTTSVRARNQSQPDRPERVRSEIHAQRLHAEAGCAAHDCAGAGGLHLRPARRSHQPAARLRAAQHRVLHHQGFPDLGFALVAKNHIAGTVSLLQRRHRSC